MNNIPSKTDEQELWKQVYLSIIPLMGFSSQNSAEHANKAVAYYRQFCKDQDKQSREAYADELL